MRTGPGIVSWTGPGNPFWDGEPGKLRTARIHLLTMKLDADVYGRFRLSWGVHWRILRDPEDYRQLNGALNASGATSARF